MNLWLFFPLGYLFTICIETPILLVGLSRRHDLRRRLFAGVWLTLCTYPVVVLVLPTLFDPDLDRWGYLFVAETFAPVAECLLFWAAFHVSDGGSDGVSDLELIRDFFAIILANLASFLIGEAIYLSDWFAKFRDAWL